MFAVSDVLALVQSAVVVALLVVTGFLLLVTATNRLRLRRIVMTWRAGRFFGAPVWPAVFIGLVVGGAAALVLTGRPLNAGVLAGLLTAGSFWFAASWLAQTVVVTDYGIVSNVNCADRVVAWGQVADYFQFRRGARSGYVFLYQDAKGVRGRLEVSVPAAAQKRFQQVLRAKLDARFEFATQQAYGKTALER